MNSAFQLELVPTANQAADREFLRLIRDVVEALGGVKVVAGELDVQASLLRNALEAKNYNHVWAEHLPWLIRHDRTDQLLRYLSRQRGYELVPARPLTDAEKLEAWERCVGRRFPIDAEALAAEVEADARAHRTRQSGGDR